MNRPTLFRGKAAGMLVLGWISAAVVLSMNNAWVSIYRMTKAVRKTTSVSTEQEGASQVLPGTLALEKASKSVGEVTMPSLITTTQSPLSRVTQAPEAPPAPIPVRVLKTYLQRHGVDSLIRQPNNRTFAVAYYACPLQAGNRMHHYLNSFLWAIVTNRTLLWDYWDRRTCFKYNKLHDGNICRTANRVRDCDQVLERAGWMPSYREWRDRLANVVPYRSNNNNNNQATLSGPAPYQLPFWTTHLNTSRAKFARAHPYRVGRDEQYTGVDDITHHKHGGRNWVVAFPQMVGKSLDLMDKPGRDYLLHTEHARQTAKALYALGPDFLYGMLFRASFRFSDRVLQINTTAGIMARQAATHDDSSLTVSLHSRHTTTRDDGCNIQREIRCLEKVLAAIVGEKNQPNENETSCRVLVMSDRICTLKNLHPWLKQKQCIMDMVVHSEPVGYGKSWRAEHGPFAGVGYYEDLVHAVKARSAFVGSGRSSSDLVAELLEYDRLMEAWESSGDVSRAPKLSRCGL